jgi:outer membrane protein OmpA-like peptidoglycan-associated protein
MSWRPKGIMKEFAVMKHRDHARTAALLASAGLVLAACSGSPPPNAALEQAQATYTAASGDPMVQRAASHELQNAQEALQTAQSAFNNGADPAEVDHYAYLAQRYSEVAGEQAKYRSSAAQVADISRTITLSDMAFATGKADLSAPGMKAVGQIATFMRNRPNRAAAINGYTDSTGSAGLNAALSAKRAAAVQTALVHQGIDPSRLQAHGLGPSNPVASNNSAAGRQQNRRVEILFSVVPIANTEVRAAMPTGTEPAPGR